MAKHRSSPRTAGGHPPAGPVCQICGDAIAEHKVWCVDCGTPSHRDCFAYNGRCPVYACTGMHWRQESAGRDSEVRWIDVRGPDGTLVPQGYVVEFTSGREGAAIGIMSLGLLISLATYLPPKGRHGPYPYWPEACYFFLALGIFGAVWRVLLRDYRILDGKTRKIWLHRSFAGWKSLRAETDFDGVTRIVLQARYAVVGKKRKKGYRWSMLAHCRTGTVIDLIDTQFAAWDPGSRVPAPPPPSVLATARKVAAILGRTYEIERDR